MQPPDIGWCSEVRRLKRKKAVRGSGGQAGVFSRTVFLAAFFIGGILLGQAFASRVPESTGAELRRYLTDFLQLEDSTAENARAVVSAAVIYFRYPLAAFLLAFTAVGAVLLPCVTVVYGCSLSFSVCCFTAAFGVEGTALALAVLGPRCLISMPCYFLLASLAWGMSVERLPIGRGRRTAPAVCGREWWLLCGVVVLVLLAGVCMELVLTPRLTCLALRYILS